MATHRTYRALTLLYPKAFRARYREDLIQFHDDLVRRSGPASAWLRTGLDLTVTVPRYRLESAMTNRHATLALFMFTAALGAAGLAIVLVGFPIGALLLGAALVLALTQRTEIAHSLRDTSPGQRRHRFAAAVVLAVVATTVLLIAFADDEWGDRGAVAYTVSFLTAASSSAGFLVSGLAPFGRTKPRNAAG